jgi:hypothetical protein
MDERYPYLRFVVDAAQVIAGVVAVIVFLGGTLSACRHGGFGGLVSFGITALTACLVYVAIMVQIEVLRVFLDIESATRQLLATRRGANDAAPPDTAS